MGRFRYSGVAITGGTGRLNSSLGGSVLLSNGVVRNYVTPSNPQTASQSETRAAFQFFTASWADLTEDQRTAWRAAWSSGQWLKQDSFTGTSRAYASAKALFIALNMNTLIAGNNLGSPVVNLPLPEAKTTPPPIGITSFVFDASSGTAVLTFTGAQDTGLVIRATPPVSPGNLLMTSVKSLLRTINSETGASPAAEGANYVAIHGPITAQTGQKVFWTIEQINDLNGQRTFVASGNSTIQA